MRSASRLLLTLALTSCAFINFAVTAFAQYAPVRPNTNTISVSGDAQINVVPDKISITLGVESINPNLYEAKSANDAGCAGILAVTQTFKINPKDVQTDYISIQPQYDPHTGLTIVGYAVRRSIVITLRDISKFDALLNSAVDHGANAVLGVQFMTSDLRKYRDQARESAIKAAKEKADLLAGALGQKAGKAVSINEQQNGWWSSYGSYNYGWGRSNGYMQSQNVSQNMSSEVSGGNDSGATLAPGQTQVRATVQVTFELD